MSVDAVMTGKCRGIWRGSMVDEKTGNPIAFFILQIEAVDDEGQVTINRVSIPREFRPHLETIDKLKEKAISCAVEPKVRNGKQKFALKALPRLMTEPKAVNS